MVFRPNSRALLFTDKCMLRSNVTTLLICAVAFLTASCADTYAAEGAKSGAVGGAVAGAVLGVFTGNIAGSAVAGAAASAAAGAAIGGMTPAHPVLTAPPSLSSSIDVARTLWQLLRAITDSSGSLCLRPSAGTYAFPPRVFES